MEECKQKTKIDSIWLLFSPSFPLLTHTDFATHSHRGGERGGGGQGAGFCRAILLVILSQRQGRAGATAVCLIACAMGVGSIIRTALPPCSNPSILCSRIFSSPFHQGGGGGCEHPLWSTEEKRPLATRRMRKRRVDVRELVLGFQPRENRYSAYRASKQIPGRFMMRCCRTEGVVPVKHKSSFPGHTDTHRRTHGRSQCQICAGFAESLVRPDCNRLPGKVFMKCLHEFTRSFQLRSFCPPDLSLCFSYATFFVSSPVTKTSMLTKVS